MPILLTKGLRYGLGMASEAIHARRDHKTTQVQTNNTARGSIAGDAPDDVLVHEDFDDRYYDEIGIHQDEAVWQLDEMSQHLEQFEAPPIAYEDADTEEKKVKEREAMTWELVSMAGPPPETQPVHPLLCPVIIPQRRPRQKARGFVPAYSPALANCGISQEVFMTFIENLNTVNRCDGWLEAVFVAAQVVGILPFPAAKIVGAVAAVAAGTAKEFQMRHRKNSFLEMVNRDLLMPRGLCAVVMTFKNKVRGQNFGTLNELFARKEIHPDEADKTTDFDQAELNALRIDEVATTATKADPDESKFKKKWKNISKLSSGKTYGEIELPETAPLVYPDLDRVAAQAYDGKTVPQGVVGKLRNAGEWVEEYMDRRANAFYAAENPDSKLIRPIEHQKPLKSRFNDPNHPANSGSLISLVSGGAIAVPGVDQVIGQGRRMAANVIQGKKPTKDSMPVDGLGPAMLKKLVTQDVLYLMIVNLPTQEEFQASVAELEGIMMEAGYTQQDGASTASY